MKFAAIQHDIVWNDREANFAALSPKIAEASANGAGFALLTEMFSTGFVVDDPQIGEPLDGPSSQFLREHAIRHSMWVGGTCAEVSPDDPRPHNTFVVASPTGELHRYNKIHPFTYGGEDKHYRAGSQHVRIDVDGLRIALFVCYDLRFADEFWPLAPATDVYLVPANWPESRRLHWMSLLQARAIENQAYVIGCNRVGTGGKLTYSGDSRIFSPLGEPLAEAGSDDTIIYADATAQVVTGVRDRFRFLQDRR